MLNCRLVSNVRYGRATTIISILGHRRVPNQSSLSIALVLRPSTRIILMRHNEVSINRTQVINKLPLYYSQQSYYLLFRGGELKIDYTCWRLFLHTVCEGAFTKSESLSSDHEASGERNATFQGLPHITNVLCERKAIHFECSQERPILLLLEEHLD